MRHKYIFGPVPSRRLGVSLGVDLIPLKTCSLDCVYCECGKTTRHTAIRKEYIDVGRVIAELDDYLKSAPRLDYITFAGSGEPTLNSGMGRVINFLKTNYPQYRVCLLTNGTLFKEKDVRSEALPLDLIIPSLDAAREETFKKINRPCEGISCRDMIEGLAKLRREYEGIITLEIFIVAGINDNEAEIKALNEAIKIIKPDYVQLGTLDRPGTEEWVEAVNPDKMREIAASLEGATLISDCQPRVRIRSFKESRSRQIIQTLRRRPCTASDLEQTLNLHQAELQKYLDHLLERGTIEATYQERGIFYRMKKTGH